MALASSSWLPGMSMVAAAAATIVWIAELSSWAAVTPFSSIKAVNSITGAVCLLGAGVFEVGCEDSTGCSDGSGDGCAEGPKVGLEDGASVWVVGNSVGVSVSGLGDSVGSLAGRADEGRGVGCGVATGCGGVNGAVVVTGCKVGVAEGVGVGDAVDAVGAVVDGAAGVGVGGDVGNDLGRALGDGWREVVTDGALLK